MLEVSELYKVSHSKRVQEMERELGAELEEIKKDIEDNLVDHIPVKMIRYNIGGGGSRGGELEEVKKNIEDNLVDYISVKMIRYDMGGV